MNYDGKPLPIKYFDKYGKSTPKPDYSKVAPEGVTAQSVLQKYIEAVGGEAKLSAVNSLHIVGAANIQGMSITFEQKRTSKKQLLQDLKMGPNSIQKLALNVDKGYMTAQGQRMEFDAERVKALAIDAYPFYEIQMVNSETIAFESTQKIDGKDAYGIQITPEKIAFYDAESGLKVKEVTTATMGGQTVESALMYENYKEVAGIKMPFLYKQAMGPQTVEIVISEIKFNEGVSDADFE